MKDWEQIAFAIALAGFSWLLYQAHTTTNSATQPTPYSSSGEVPFFLTFNQTAGYTGPLQTSIDTTQASTTNLPASSSPLSVQNVSMFGCTSCGG